MGKHRTALVLGDITELKVDALVNAANTALLGGGGVDGAIHRAAGPQLLEACRKLQGCETGQAKLTDGYALAARYVIHTVGPIWQGGHHNEEQLLRNCYRNSLRLALDTDVDSIAFPAISCGVYGYPIDQAASIAVAEVEHYLATAPGSLEVTFCCFEPHTYAAYKNQLSA